MSSDALMLPTPNEETAGFWEGCGAGELRMQVCTSCGRRRFPPRVMCPHCHSTERAWQTVSGRGTIWSYVVPHPPLLPAYELLAPYNVIVVTLDEDPSLRLIGNLVTGPEGEINEIDPSTIEIGEAVEVVFSHRTGADGRSMALPEWVRSGHRVARARASR